MTFPEFFHQKMFDPRIRPSSLNSIKTTYNHLIKFAPDIPMAKIDHHFIESFDTYLRNEGMATSTVHKVHRHVRKIVRLALQDDLIARNPYDRFKPTAPSTTRKFLTQDERDKIVGVGGYFAEVFEFQTSVGLHIGDLLAFGAEKVEVITIDKCEYRLIRGNRKKNGEPYIIPLSPRAEEIAKKYNYKFSFKPDEYNEWLKSTAKGLGITKKVTSCVARHTFATLSLAGGASIEAVSGSMGHTSIITTQIYAKITGDKIVRDFLNAGMMK
jgi:integrase/recombinase XerD